MDRPKRLILVTANLWRGNKHVKHDLLRLARSMAHLIALNEAANFKKELREVPGYRLCIDGERRPEEQNPVLVRRDVPVTGVRTVTMCEPVGRSPERTATIVHYRLHGQRRSHISTHANSHVQEGRGPHELPRVAQYVQHMIRLRRLVRRERRRGFKVTVSGDLNWAFYTGWQWFSTPVAVFRSLRMRTQFQHKTAVGPTHGRRRIDYLAHSPRDLRVVGQRLLQGHSDHKWPLVVYSILD